MSKAGFPQEILDEITAVVANLGDHSVLASLSLASKEHFLRQCQSYIHRTLRINRAQPTNGSTQILKANPSLFGFAKELIIEDRPDYDINIQSTTEERRNHAQAILKIFEYATGGVETLLLHTNHLTRIRGKDTSEGDLELDGAVIRQFFTPRLVNLAFSTRNIPLHSFQSIPSLRSLRIETGDLLSNEGVSEGVGGHAEEFPWHLKSLQCVYDGLDSAAVLFKTSPRALCRSLVYITLNIQTVVQQRTAMSIVQEVAQDVSPRLEALELVYRGRSGKASHQEMCAFLVDFETTVQSLPSLPCLHFFHLWVHHDFVPLRSNEALYTPTTFIRLLTAILGESKQPALECIHTGVYWHLYDDPRTHLHLPILNSCQRWEKLDRILSNSGAYPSLSAVGVLPEALIPSLDGASYSEVSSKIAALNALDRDTGLNKTHARLGSLGRSSLMTQILYATSERMDHIYNPFSC